MSGDALGVLGHVDGLRLRGLAAERDLPLDRTVGAAHLRRLGFGGLVLIVFRSEVDRGLLLVAAARDKERRGESAANDPEVLGHNSAPEGSLPERRGGGGRRRRAAQKAPRQIRTSRAFPGSIAPRPGARESEARRRDRGASLGVDGRAMLLRCEARINAVAAKKIIARAGARRALRVDATRHVASTVERA
jgi:hypothetical protein